MTPTVRDLLAAFDALSPAEQHEAATEILRHTGGTGALPEEGLHELAAELFHNYDTEEAARAAP